MITFMLWLTFGFHEFVSYDAEPDPDVGIIWQGDDSQLEQLA